MVENADHANHPALLALEVDNEHVIVKDVKLVMQSIIERRLLEHMPCPTVLVNVSMLSKLSDARLYDADNLSKLLARVFGRSGVSVFQKSRPARTSYAEPLIAQPLRL